MKYKLQISKDAQKSLSKISEPYQSKIIDKIYNMSSNPYHNAVKLTGRKAYRIRIGNYRVIYEIKHEVLVVLVVGIGHRKDIYQT